MVELIGRGGVIGTVNLSEIVARLAQRGMSEAEIHEAMEMEGLEVAAFDTELAYGAGMLRPLTMRAGLSLGDWACLALARRLGLPVLTADRVWAELDLGVEIHLIR